MAANLTGAVTAGLVKTGKSRNVNSYQFNSLQMTDFDNVASISASQANTSLLAYMVLPQAAKVAKVSVSLTAIAAITGTHSFNVVMGTTGAYTQGSVGPQDTSQLYGYPPSTSFTFGGVTYAPYAVNGNALFAADVPFTAVTFPGNPQLGGPSTNANGGMGTLITTATGGSTVLVPTVWDCVYPAGAVFTLRATTPSSTGSISNLKVGLLLEFIDPCPQSSAAIPNVSW
jgi:hypothetical protein